MNIQEPTNAQGKHKAAESLGEWHLKTRETVAHPIFWEPSLTFLKLAIAFTFAGSAAYELVLLIIAPWQTIRLLVVLMFPLVAGAGWILLKRGNTRACVWTLVAGTWSIITVSSFFFGGVNGTTIIIYPMIIIFVGWMFSTRAAVALAILTAAVTLCFLLCESWGMAFPPPETPLILRWLIQGLVYAVAATMIGFLVRFYRDRLEEVGKLSRDLAVRTAELRDSESDLHAAQAVARVGSWIYDVAGKTLQLSAETCRIFGLPTGTAGNLDLLLARAVPEDRKPVESAWRAALRGSAPFDIEHRIQIGNDIHWVRYKTSIERSADGAPRRAVGIVQEITESKGAEEKLRGLTETLRLGQMAARLVVADWDIRNDTLKWTDSVEWLRGPLPADGRYPTFRDQVHPDDLEKFLSAREKSNATLEGQMLDYRVIGTDGKTRWVHSQPVVFAGADGKAARQLIALLDITERKAVEADLRMSEARFRQLFEMESDAIFLLDVASGRIIEVNAAAETMYGYSRAELLALTAAEMSAEPDETRATIRKPEIRVALRRHRKKDGTEITVEIAGRAFELEGRLVHVAAIRDITQRIAAEEAMRESEALYRTLIERSPEAIAVHRDGKYIYFNPTADKILGATPENNLVGKPVLDLVHPDSREFVLARIAALAKEGGSTPMAEMKLVRLDGTAIDVEAQGTQICHKGVPTTYVLWRDITARKQAEATNAALQAQLLEARKMEALGTLAGGIAHDFNNILASIRGSVQLARTELRAPPVVSKSLNQIETSAARALELVRQILAFSRGQKNVRTAQDMTIAVDEAVKILRAALPSTIDIQTRLESNLPFVETSLVAVHQLVMNLGVNAAHAMADAGRLDIEVDAVDVDSALAGKVHKLESRSAVRLTVRDSGSGMDSGTKTRAFEPFFSTKGPDAGTGLGLSVVYGIVKEHGAEIDIDSAPGKGTTFRIYFSAVARETQSGGIPADSSAAPIRGQGERLLFVDDEDELVALSQTLLEKMGYQVRTCHNGEEALDAFARDPDAFDAMITDITMPGMSGLDLAQKIREIRADFPVILMSGHVRDADAQRAGALGLGEIHWKPNTVSDLAETLRERLRRAKP